jgi:hypothetical protein
MEGTGAGIICSVRAEIACHRYNEMAKKNAGLLPDRPLL